MKVGNMNEKTIIHIVVGPLPLYSAIGMRIEQTLQEGVDVQVWDLTEMIGLPIVTHLVYQDLIVYIKNKKKLQSEIEKNRQALFVTGINPERRFFWVFYYLAKYQCRHCKIANNWIRVYPISKWKWISELRQKIKMTILNLLNSLNLFSLPQYVFVCGKYWNDKFPGKPKIINVNHFLYDQFLIQKKETGDIKKKEKYILFLDGALTHHPDWEIMNIKTLSDQLYYEKMKWFFAHIEEKFKMPIIVAAHPKSKYSGDEFGSGRFGLREIVYNQTDKLAKNADIFLAHFSTTRILSIIYFRPLYLIWLNEFRYFPSIIQGYIFGLHNEIDCPILDEKSFEENFTFFSPSMTKYKDFLYKYYVVKEYENINTLDLIGKKMINFLK